MAKRRKKASKFVKSLMRVGKSLLKQGRYLAKHGVASTVTHNLTKQGMLNNATQARQQNIASVTPSGPTPGLVAFNAANNAKPYGQLTQNLGKRVLSLGTNLPPNLVAVAQQAAMGTGNVPERQVLEQLRGALGIEHSGATAVNRFTGSVRNTVQGGAQLGILVNAAQGGGAVGSVAQGRLAMKAIDKLDDLTKNENIVKIATKLGEAIGADSLAGSRFLYALSRGLQLGGAVAAVALAAWDVGASYISNQKRSAAAQGASYDAARQAGLLATPELASSERSRVSTDAAQTAGAFDQVLAKFGFSGAIEERKAAVAKQQFDAIAGARANAARNGVDVPALLQEAARKKGKSVSQLNDREKAEALNKAASDTLRQRADSDAAKRYAKTQMLINDEAPGVFQGLAIGLSHALGYKTVGEMRVEAKERRYRDDFANKSSNARQESLAEDRVQTFQKFRASWSKEQNEKLDRELRDSQFRLAEHRSRHKVNWFD
jgi:hypothetical protein